MAPGRPRKYDVSVTPGHVPRFVGEVVHVCARWGLAAHHWGHLGDGNVHLNVPGATAGLDPEVLSVVAAHGGSISAEHGIGRLKRPYLHLSRSPAEIGAMVAIKRALDPGGILNPGVLLPG